MLNICNWYPHALHSQLLYSWPTTNKTRSWNKQACYHCSLINTIHLKGQACSPKTWAQWLWTMSRTEHVRTGHQRSDHPRVFYIHHTMITTPFLNGHTTPHTTNSQSLWESLNGSSCDRNHDWSPIWFFSNKQTYFSQTCCGHSSSLLSQAFYQSNSAILVLVLLLLCPLIWAWNSLMLLNPFPAACGLIDHRAFFTDSTKRPPMLHLFTAKRTPSSIHLGATWWSLLMTRITFAFCCVVCSPIALPNSSGACVSSVVWFKAASISWISVGHTHHPHYWWYHHEWVFSTLLLNSRQIWHTFVPSLS